MEFLEKIGKVAESVAKKAQSALSTVAAGTHNIMRGLTGVVTMNSLKNQRAKERENRTVETRIEKRALRASRYYFIDAISKTEYGPEEIRGWPGKKQLESVAKKYFICCPECGRWISKSYWNEKHARCEICVEEERYIAAQSLPKDPNGNVIWPDIPETKILIEEERIPERCSQCAHPLKETEIKWVSPDKYECSACGTQFYVERIQREITR